MREPRARVALTCSSLLLAGYLVTVLLLDRDVGAWHVSLGWVALLTIASGLLAGALLARLARATDPARHVAAKLAALQLATLVTLLGVDLSFAALRSWTALHHTRRRRRTSCSTSATTITGARAVMRWWPHSSPGSSADPVSGTGPTASWSESRLCRAGSHAPDDREGERVVELAARRTMDP
jgi:hypothetical protein